MQPFVRAFGIACLPMALSAQAKFEGTITARMASAQGSAEATYMVKGDQFRMDMSSRGQTMYIVRDLSKTASIMVMPAQRMYMEMQAPSTADLGTGNTGKKLDVKMTGRKETIAGVECEHVLITSDDAQYDACVAHGLGTFPAMNNPMGRGRGAQAPPGWQKLGRDAFPLRVQRVGGELAFEVTKIERKSLDASLFTVPEGFQKFDMGAMGRGRPPGDA